MKDFITAFYYVLYFMGIEALHFAFMRFVLESETDFLPIYKFTTFILALVLAIVVQLNMVAKSYIGFLFLFVMGLKLFVAKIFMDRQGQLGNPEFKYSFVVLYLISLVLITVFLVKLLKQAENDKKQKNTFPN